MLSSLSPGVKSTLAYGLINVICKACGVLMLPITSRYLDPDSFGLLEVLVTIIYVFILFDFGAQSLQRFAAKDVNSAEFDKQLASAVFSVLLFALPISTLFLCSAYYWQPQLFSSLVFVGITIFFALVYAPMFTAMRLENRLKAYGFFAIFYVVTQTVLTIVGLMLGYGINAVLAANALSSSLSCLLAFVLYRKCFTRKNIDYHLVQINYRYQWPLVFAGILAFIYQGLDKWVLADMVSLASVAYYGIASKFVMIALFAMLPVQQWWHAKRFAILDKHNDIAALSRITNVIILMHLITSVTIISISLCLFEWIVPRTYDQAKLIIPALTLAYTFKNLPDLVATGAYAADRPWGVPIINACAALACIIGYILLVPEQGIVGLLYLLNGVFFIRMFCFFCLSQYHIPMTIPWFRQSMLIILMSLICLMLSWQTQPLSVILSAPIMMLIAAYLLNLLPPLQWFIILKPSKKT